MRIKKEDEDEEGREEGLGSRRASFCRCR